MYAFLPRMRSFDLPPEPLAVDVLPDEHARLLWRIARRADELVQATHRQPGLNRVCWLIAEQEVAGALGMLPEQETRVA